MKTITIPCKCKYCGKNSDVVRHIPDDMILTSTESQSCQACDSSYDKKRAKLILAMTGSSVDDRGTVRWRLRASESELTAALEAGRYHIPQMVRDSGDDPSVERAMHRIALVAMECGRIRCGCGSYGTWSRTVSGTIGTSPAIWAECENCRGSAIGGGLVGEDMHTALAAIEAAARCDADIDDWVDNA